jgi:hypothetical protein
VRAANPELFIWPSLKKGKVKKYKYIIKDKKKVKKILKERRNMHLFIIPTMRLIFHGLHISKEKLFYWTKWLNGCLIFSRLIVFAAWAKTTGSPGAAYFLLKSYTSGNPDRGNHDQGR